MPTVRELGQKVKAKYPEYADLDDVDLGRRVQKKFPGEYDDFTELPGTEKTGLPNIPKAPLPAGLQGPAEPERGPVERFASSAISAINPLPALREYAQRPEQAKTLSKALSAGMASRGRQRTPEELAAIEKGAQVPLGPGMQQPLPSGTEPLVVSGTQFQQGDVAGGLGTLAGSYGLPVATARAIRKVGTRTGRAELAQTKAKVLEKIPGVGPQTPKSLMIKAAKPRNTNFKFEGDLDRAMPEMAMSADEVLSRPIANIDDAIQATTAAKKRIWAQQKAGMAGQEMRPINLEEVGDAIERTISSRTKLMDPDHAKAVQGIANKYRGRTFTLQEAEGFLHDVNAELENAHYYAKTPHGQHVARSVSQDTAILNAEAEILRNRVYGEIDRSGQGAGPRELSRRYGALLNVEEELRKRKNVADRQAQVSLGEQIGWVQGIGQAAKGAYRIYHGDVFGAGDIAAGMAMKRLASELKELNTTNSMIKRAFENYKGRPTPVTVQPFQPRGLLGPGPLVTPPPADPSFVRGVPGMYPAGPDPRRALTPSDTLITPPPADASGIQIVDAARGIARDPKTGRMFRYYTSGRAPNLESPEPLR